MLFPTIDFAIFFVVVFAGNWLLRPYPKPWRWFIVLASCFFYLNPLDPTHQQVNLLALVLLVGLAAGASWLLRTLASSRDPGQDDRRAVIGVLAVVIGAYVLGNVVLASRLVTKPEQPWKFLFLLIGLAVVNQTFARATWAFLDPHGGRTAGSRWVVRLAVAFDLGVLGYFKYLNWFNDSIKASLDVTLPIPLPDALLPLAISFFTFQAISYVIDIGRSQLRPIPLLDFTLYLSFFAHLVAGPIVRVGEFAPQIDQPSDPRFVQSAEAFMLIFRGLFKKVVVSSYLAATLVDPVFAAPGLPEWGRPDAIGAILGYAIQIYADFSGYTDIAIGVALLLGIRFPQNFDAPYRSLSFQDFWRRWHMTLSRWLRDYLYIPLGGNRVGETRTYVNLFLTMLLGGLWHGANVTFVIWGAIHGGALGLERFVKRVWHEPGSLDGVPAFTPVLLGLTTVGLIVGWLAGGVVVGIGVAAVVVGARFGFHALDRATRATRSADGSLGWPPMVVKPAQWVLTFGVVCVAWVFFRARTFDDATTVLHLAAFGGASVSLTDWLARYWLLVVIVVASIASQFVPPRIPERVTVALSRTPPALQIAGLAVGIVLIDALGPEGIAPFIYFNF